MRALRKSSPTPGYSLAEAIYHYHDDDDDDLEEEEDDNVYVEEEMNKSRDIYRVIIVSNHKISCNIVWIQKKDIAEGCL